MDKLIHLSINLDEIYIEASDLFEAMQSLGNFIIRQNELVSFCLIASSNNSGKSLAYLFDVLVVINTLRSLEI